MKKLPIYLFIILLVGMFIASSYYFSNTKTYTITSSSMYPSLLASENRRGWIIKNPKEVLKIPRKSIIAYKNIDSIFIGRILAFPGENIEVRNSQIYINEKPLAEPYVTWNGNDTQIEKITVDEKQVIVLKDKRSELFLNFTIVPIEAVEANIGVFWKESDY